MKKILSLTLALAMIGSILTGCGSKNAASEAPDENSTQQTAPVQQAVWIGNAFILYLLRTGIHHV